MPRIRPKIVLKAAALAPAFVVGLPAQWLALKMRGGLKRRLPVLFHRYVCRVLGLRVRVVGAPVEGKPTLIVSNHTSWLDIVALGALMPVSFIAKSEVAAWPGVGTLARLQRSVFVHRDRKAATARVAGAIGERLAAGDAMVLFAEGTTSDGGRILPFRSALIGAARSALGDETATVIIQPLSVIYTHRDGLPIGKAGRPFVAWYGDMDLVPHLADILAGGPLDAQIEFGAPLEFSPGGDRKRAARMAERQVRAAARRAITGRPDFDARREKSMEA